MECAPEIPSLKNHCLGDKGGGSAIVVANVVERSSWEKSGCGRKCRFPAKGGLHHTSGDASLVTKPEIPSWCHVYKLQSVSSKRTRVAAMRVGLADRALRGVACRSALGGVPPGRVAAVADGPALAIACRPQRPVTPP